MGMENESETRALLAPVIHEHKADTRTFNILLALNKDNKLPVEYSLRLYDTMLAVRTPHTVHSLIARHSDTPRRSTWLRM